MIAYVVDETTKLSEQDAWNIAWALNFQAAYQFGRSGWRSDVRCMYVPKGAEPRIDRHSIVLHLLDSLDVAGALGYHDEDGNEIPYARVGVAECEKDGAAVSEVASHELLELAVDPHVNLTALSGDAKYLWALEVGDPCQGNAYDVGAPAGRPTGVVVADFVLPNFFDPNTAIDAPTTFTKALKGPFTVAPQGYYSYIDMLMPSEGWHNGFGSERHTAPPDWDDRNRATRTP